ncbi:hypothetical protein PTE30175_02901 [Pandoraea terrae]|uniref:Calcium/calmodulin-dependent protein kinase II association-domain domain-containing protein n=1 Tax=Pandoraea terrae TaxID=1537710 RepID=A0A5E4W3B3_9BURK|nr:protein kinase [Pandoraea terrae]VVE18074.1 hypothetical protein PTE30175_02901 [Pandoraea terrae]
MKLLLSAVLGLTAAAPAFAQYETCRQIEEKQAEALFDRWNDSLKTGDPERVVANYAHQSMLLPTLSNAPRLTPESKADYFKHFLAKKPVGTIDMRSILIGCNTVLDTGLYTFKFDDGAKVAARYTFTYQWEPSVGKWLITSHHSSAQPESSD